MTTVVKAVAPGDKVPDKGVKVGFHCPLGWAYYLIPCNLKNVIEPFWFVKTTHEEHDANVDWVRKNVHITIAKDEKYVISVPVLSNAKTIDMHIELAMFQPALERLTKKRVLTIGEGGAQVASKARSSKD